MVLSFSLCPYQTPEYYAPSLFPCNDKTFQSNNVITPKLKQNTVALLFSWKGHGEAPMTRDEESELTA